MSKTLLIMAAGTGGHIMPGLAVAETMRSRGWQVQWLGTSHGMENWLVPAKSIPMSTLNFSGLRGKGLLHSFTGVFKLAVATFKAWKLMGKLQPKAILGMGGYVTVPGGWAAKARKLPLVLVNADAALLMSNKALLPSAKRVLFVHGWLAILLALLVCAHIGAALFHYFIRKDGVLRRMLPGVK